MRGLVREIKSYRKVILKKKKSGNVSEMPRAKKRNSQRNYKVTVEVIVLK